MEPFFSLFYSSICVCRTTAELLLLLPPLRAFSIGKRNTVPAARHWSAPWNAQVKEKRKGNEKPKEKKKEKKKKKEPSKRDGQVLFLSHSVVACYPRLEGARVSVVYTCVVNLLCICCVYS